MMLKIIGSHLCPNTIYSIIKCKEAGVPFTFQDISANLSDLKSFLALHEHDKVYEYHRNMSGENDYLTAGKIGLPCFVFEDGCKTLDLDEVLKRY